jgi:hypothetical protein
MFCLHESIRAWVEYNNYKNYTNNIEKKNEDEILNRFYKHAVEYTEQEVNTTFCWNFLFSCSQFCLPFRL